MTVGKGGRIGGEGRGNRGGGGESGRGREAWAHGPGHRLSNCFKPDPLTGQRA